MIESLEASDANTSSKFGGFRSLSVWITITLFGCHRCTFRSGAKGCVTSLALNCTPRCQVYDSKLNLLDMPFPVSWRSLCNFLNIYSLHPANRTYLQVLDHLGQFRLFAGLLKCPFTDNRPSTNISSYSPVARNGHYSLNPDPSPFKPFANTDTVENEVANP